MREDEEEDLEQALLKEINDYTSHSLLHSIAYQSPLSFAKSLQRNALQQHGYPDNASILPSLHT